MPVKHTYIKFNNVKLVYDLYNDKTNNLKEFVVNLFTKRKYITKKIDKVFALNGVDVTFTEGERVGIIGRNGAGKSTMLKVISGILKPTEGNLEVNGTIQPLIEIGAGFDPEFTGRENIYLNGYMLGFTKAQVQAKEAEIIEFAELGEFIDVPVKYYSSGMSVRLAFTIATSIEPEILAFDEMLSAGDIEFIKKAKARMQALLNKAKMMVIVSHDLHLIHEMCSRVLVMHHGQICYDGPAPEAIQFYLQKGYMEPPA